MIIKNKGQAIVHTDYWDSEHAKAGALYLSWNAGAARLLVPDAIKPVLRELRGAREVIISRGPWEAAQGREGLELLWEDRSDAPFSLHILSVQSDRRIPETDQGGGFVVTVWTRGGQKGRWPGRFRIVESLTCLQPWSEQ